MVHINSSQHQYPFLTLENLSQENHVQIRRMAPEQAGVQNDAGRHRIELQKARTMKLDRQYSFSNDAMFLSQDQ